MDTKKLRADVMADLDASRRRAEALEQVLRGLDMLGPEAPVVVGKIPRLGKAVCPDCGFVAKGPQGLSAHRRSQHGYVKP